MKTSKDIVTSKQLIFTITSATVGVGLLTLPETLVKTAQQDGWISLLLGALLPLAGLFLINLIGSRFPNFSFAEYSEKILGKWLGKLLATVFAVYAILYAALVTRIFVNILKIYLFPATPMWALGGLVISVAAYLTAKDARILARVNELMFWESQVLFFSLFLAFPNIDFTFYQPLTQVGASDILKGSYQTIFSYLGIEVLLVFYPMVTKKKDIVKAGLTAIGLVLFIYLGVVLTTLGVFGPFVLPKLRFSLMVLLKTYKAPVIERAEFFFVIFYVFVAFRPVATMFFAGRYTTEKIIGIQAPGWVTLFLAPITLLLSLIPSSVEETIAYSSDLGYLGIAFLTVIPLLLWLISKLRGVGGEGDYA